MVYRHSFVIRFRIDLKEISRIYEGLIPYLSGCLYYIERCADKSGFKFDLPGNANLQIYLPLG